MTPFRGDRASTNGGTMPLVEHLRELRLRLFKAVLAIVVGMVIGWFLYDPVYDLLSQPYIDGIAPLLERKGFDASLTITGVGGAFTFKLKLALLIGLLISSPFWLWQMWAFILPALRHNERKWIHVLSGIGAPLFAAGIVLGYVVLPKGIEVLIGFAPESVSVLITLGDYLNFVVRTLLVFGVAAEIPLVVILLNRLGIVSAAQLAKARPWTIIGIFVFAAVATPSTDPLTMLFLAMPMTVLYFISEVIARLTDKRKKSASPEELADDELSPLDD